MYNRDREFEVNEKQAADFLEQAVSKVKTTEDIDTLSDLNKLFKKNVPLTLRKYVIAYLLKESLKHFHSYDKANNRNNRENRNDRSEKADRNSKSKTEFKQNNRSEKTAEPAPAAATETEQTEERQHHPRVEIPEAEATSIFISIGKNRRVYPRDLVGLLIGVANLDRERIGDIKVLANYSFVQLYSADAPAAIEKLNGYDYRGRKLAVSYSRQKSEEETTAAPTAETAGYTSEAQDPEMAAEDAAAYAAAEKAANNEPFGGVQ